MTPVHTFNQMVEMLTTEHPGFVKTDDGMVLKKQPALLVQLRQAVYSGMEGTGGTSSFGSKPPIDAGAVDILDEITRQAAEALATVDSRPTPYGHAEAYVALWAAATQEDAHLVVTKRATSLTDPPVAFDERIDTTAFGLLAMWVHRITGFFSPPVIREIKEPCPQCGIRYLDVVKDGQQIQTSAFNFLCDRETQETLEARCNHCGATWSRAEFAFLAVAIGAVKEGETYDEVVARHAAS